MAEIAQSHHFIGQWDQAMQQLRSEIARRALHPARVVVLLPYVQLIGEARNAWLRAAGTQPPLAAFLPRFETTRTWSRSLGAFVPGGDDLRGDVARDLLTAATLLGRVGLGGQQRELAGVLVESAWSVADLAAAVPMQQRSGWGQALLADIDASAMAPALQWEARIARVALAWAAHSAYASDGLFAADCDLLFIVQGLQHDPLHAALRDRWGDRAVSVPLAPAPRCGGVRLFRAADAEDEAEQAVACVLHHLAQGRVPVALVAQDRVLTRRARALLEQQGVAIRDETGWTLSTTRAAALVMGLLRALAWDASCDSVLAWAKQAPMFEAAAVSQLEADLRRRGVREWRKATTGGAVAARIDALRAALRQTRTLSRWLADLRGVLQQAGQWVVLLQDAAGQAVLDALHLQHGAEEDFADTVQPLEAGAFMAWVAQVLEAGSFSPPHPTAAQVVVLPLSQLFGRTPAAVVLPGCDEVNLAACPEPPGHWSGAQREWLGLPTRAQLALAVAAGWQTALGSPWVDLLWRASDGGEPVLPSLFVQQLQLDGQPLSADPRSSRQLVGRQCSMPRPSTDALAVTQLTATGYDDLRRCPYRFFALRQLGLREPEELEAELGRRDFGNWLHLVLRHFHQALAQSPVPDGALRVALLDAAATRATQELELAESEFLPFAASWPQLRTAYLGWLRQHEASGARFERAEAPCEVPLGALRLVGRIDRIDLLADRQRLVIDYKSEARETTQARIRTPMEDTQLAFYAALLEDDTVQAMYLHLPESGPPKELSQPAIVALRDQLLQAIAHDMARIAAGAALPALGAGAACEHCAARGLCRRDFWAMAVEPADG